MSTMPSTKTTGVKGSDCFSSTGSGLTDLWLKLNRGYDLAALDAAVTAIWDQGTAQDREDLFVMAFQTRDIRGGKGERALFYTFWHTLNKLKPNAATRTIKLIPEYGYWEDLNKLAQGTNNGLTVATIIQHIVDQIRVDSAALTEPNPKLTLVGRHAPREHNNKPEDKALAKAIARRMFPDDKECNKKYRQKVSALANALKVAEVAMSAHNWSSLNPASMPGRCLKTKLKGLLNQPIKGSQYGRNHVLTDPDRIACAAKFTAHLDRSAKGEAKVKGANVVFPYELVEKALKHLDSAPFKQGRWVNYDDDNDSDHMDEHGYYENVPNPDHLSPTELNALDAQWLSIEDDTKALGALGSWLAMCDFSGSMGGKPLYNSMALGLLIAACNTGVFKDTILTFDSTPTLYKLKTTGLVSRVAEIRHLAQGLSTDFQAAYNLVLKTLIDASTPADQWPKYLLCLTDMGFDAACGFGGSNAYGGGSYRQAVKTADHETHMQIIRRAFEKQGQALFGEAAAPAAPICVCWNLSGSTQDFQALSSEPGVLQVSGWSPSLIKLLATRGIDAFNSETLLRSVLDDPRYDAVRNAVSILVAPLLPYGSGIIDFEGVD